MSSKINIQIPKELARAVNKLSKNLSENMSFIRQAMNEAAMNETHKLLRDIDFQSVIGNLDVNKKLIEMDTLIDASRIISSVIQEAQASASTTNKEILKAAAKGFDLSEFISQELNAVQESDTINIDFEALYDSMEERVQKLENGHSAKQYIIDLINFVAQAIIILIMLNQGESQKISSQNEIKEDRQSNLHLEKIEEHLAKTYSFEQRISVNSSIFLQTNKKSTLRKFPDTKSDSIYTILPNRNLDLLDDTKYWYKVQFVNLEKDEQDIGWIYKGHVDIIEVN
ncbi:MAG: SH3 domain-containing protein [Gracilimonas sp.]